MASYPKYNDISGTGVWHSSRVAPLTDLERHIIRERDAYRNTPRIYNGIVYPIDYVRPPDEIGLSVTDATTITRGELERDRAERSRRAMIEYARESHLPNNQLNNRRGRRRNR